MIELKTKQSYLDLLSDSNITIKKKNPLFTILEKEGNQSYSFPFRLPLSPRNNTVLKKNLLEQKEDSISVTAKKNGVRLFKADMRITKRTDENYEVALQLNQKVDLFNKKLNTLWDQLGTFFITDSTRYVDLEFAIHWFFLQPNWSSHTATVEAIVTGIKYIVTDTFDQIITTLANAINADSVNNNATASVTDTVKLRIEEVNPSLPFFAYSQNWNTRFGTALAYGACGLVPLPKSNDINQTLSIQHANTVDALTDFREVPYCFPYFLVGHRINHHNGIQYEEYGSSGGYGTFSVILPSLRITAIIEKVLSVENWKLESSFLKNEEIEKLFILNSFGIARKSSQDRIENPIQFLQFFLSDCLPNISFAELIKELSILFCLNVNYDHTRKILTIEPADVLISNKIAKTYECTPVFSEKEKDIAEGYTFKYNLPAYLAEEEETVNSSLLAEKIIENGSVEIISDFPFLPTLALPDNSGYALLQGLPIAEALYAPASVAAFGYHRAYELFLTKKFVLKEGIIKSINFMSYIETRRCKADTENYSLTWERLYEQFYKNYLSLLDNSEVEREIIFTFSELQSLDLLKRIRLEYSNYYIKELEYTLLHSEQIRILGKVILIKTI